MSLKRSFLVLIGLVAVLHTSASATIITSTANATITATQNGLYHVDAGLFSTDTGWDAIWPRDQWGYSQVIWQVDIPGVSIPDGSIINSATLDWNQYSWRDQSISANVSCVFCLSGSLYVSGGAETFVNWVKTGGDYYWLPRSDYNSTGSFNLLALGFANALLNGDSVSFNGGHQVNLANAQVDLVSDFFLSNTEFTVTYNNHMTMTGTLTVDYTAPPTPPSNPPPQQPTPEPASLLMVACGSGLIALGIIRRGRAL